jgi:hypothetical protein
MNTPNGMESDPRHGPQPSTYPADGHSPTDTTPAAHEPSSGHSGHSGHGLMMIICCVPMLVIAGLLVLTGVAGAGLILSALLCTAMMAAMMFAMPGGHGGHK